MSRLRFLFVLGLLCFLVVPRAGYSDGATIEPDYLGPYPIDAGHKERIPAQV